MTVSLVSSMKYHSDQQPAATISTTAPNVA